MPSLERLHQNFKGEPFVLIGIDISEERETVLNYAQRNSLTFTNLLDKDGGVSTAFGVRSTPSKVLIDKEGNLVGMSLGYREWDTEEIKSLIRMILNKK
ncbi:MAG: TlpA family protein disulfide reductase [Nitrospirae bacterium]|nr:TlpA family protein disulfide reductase [Nitrospirota bacterium]